jgi:hypothetical protein
LCSFTSNIKINLRKIKAVTISTEKTKICFKPEQHDRVGLCTVSPLGDSSSDPNNRKIFFLFSSISNPNLEGLNISG